MLPINIIDKSTGLEAAHNCYATRLIVLFLVLSFLSHFLIVKAIYRLSPEQAKEDKKTAKIINKVNKFALKMPLFEHNKVKEIEKANDKPKTILQPKAIPSAKEESTESTKPGKTQTRKAKKLSSEELVALGKEHINKVREGSFPSLILNYSDPYTYMRELYNLGAKTLIYNKMDRELFEIDLFTEEILPFDNSEVEGFSSFKRVVEDSQWTKQKNQASSRLNTSPEYLEILVLIPSSLEMQWVGHQVALFQEMRLQISDVMTVEALFRKARLKLERVHLKDGSSKEVNDQTGT